MAHDKQELLGRYHDLADDKLRSRLVGPKNYCKQVPRVPWTVLALRVANWTGVCEWAGLYGKRHTSSYNLDKVSLVIKIKDYVEYFLSANGCMECPFIITQCDVRLQFHFIASLFHYAARRTIFKKCVRSIYWGYRENILKSSLILLHLNLTL